MIACSGTLHFASAVEYMRLALDGLAHFQGGWWLWIQKADEETKQEICSLYKTLAFNKWEWALKPFVNMTMEIYIDMLEARKEDPDPQTLYETW